jgi:integrase
MKSERDAFRCLAAARAVVSRPPFRTARSLTQAVRRHLPAPFRDVLDFAYYSGWRRREILELTWSEMDWNGRVIRLAPERSKTRVSRILPISPPLAAVLTRHHRRQSAGTPAVFHRDGVTVRAWRRALVDACAAAGVPARLLHDCRRTAARNLVRAGVPERVAMMFTGHRSRALFDRYNIVNERDLFTARNRLVRYLAGQTCSRNDHRERVLSHVTARRSR